ncbi:MAG: TIGR02206 family membrane protein [Verrucomicrobiota bacterium]|nr:TIGR02206 family membrane protein [Verrucomicrobiota bacterium]
MNPEREFHAYSLEHLIVIFLTIALPFALAALVRQTGSRRLERAVIIVILAALIGNYLGYLVFIRRLGDQTWTQMLPMQMCDWALVVIMVALWTARPRWFEVAYFWGIGGTLQAILTPNLRYAFPDVRFISFFVAHSGVIVGVVFLMLTRRLRPYPISIVRAFLWSEVYFACAMLVDQLTGVNYGFLLHKPEAFSLLSYLADARPIYLLQMHLLALVFFVVLYLPFAIYDLLGRGASRNGR